MKKNKLYNEDCLDTMSRMKDNYIDLVITSPPYDNLRSYDNAPKPNFKKIIRELYRVTKPGGVVVWIVSDATIDGSETGTSFRQALYFKKVGFLLHDTMIYRKKNPPPRNHNRYEQEFEYMFVFSKGKPKTFNPIKVKCKYHGRVSKSRSFRKNISTGDDSLAGSSHNKPTKRTKIKNNIWTYGAPTKQANWHPAIFSLYLVADHIVSWSNEGDLIYDPFMGSGTVAVVAKLAKRKYIGSEINRRYYRKAKKRIKAFSQEV